MPIDLQSIGVLVTRPGRAGSELCRLIERSGGQAIYFPTIAFKPTLSATLAPLLAQVVAQDWLIFISPQAVYYSHPLIQSLGCPLPPSVKCAAIGAGTAHALAQASYEVAAVPCNWHSEGLLNLSIFQNIAGQKIMLVRGEGGRELISHTLASRGAILTDLVVYQRTLPELEEGAVWRILHLIETGKIEVIICASFTAVAYLKTLIGEAGWDVLRKIPLLVISERIKLLAYDLGFQTIWVAPNPSQHAILEALASLNLQRRNRG